MKNQKVLKEVLEVLDRKGFNIWGYWDGERLVQLEHYAKEKN